MFIVPYIHNKQTLDKLIIHSIQILCEGGTKLWEEDDSIDVMQDILVENDLHLLHGSKPIKCVINDNILYFCNIDRSKTDMNNFYNWNELNTGDDTICWRKIIDIENNQKKWIENTNIYINNIKFDDILDIIKKMQ